MFLAKSSELQKQNASIITIKPVEFLLPDSKSDRRFVKIKIFPVSSIPNKKEFCPHV
jgi:hypothetical protein